MPAPTALQRAPAQLAQEEAALLPVQEDGQAEHALPGQNLHLAEGPLDAEGAQTEALHPLDTNAMSIDVDGAPHFPPETNLQPVHRSETRKIPVPPHRMTPLKSSWPKIYPPLVTHLKLQVRMNVKSRAIELRTSKHTTDSGALQKGEDFVRAFTLGFDVDDAIALLRLDDLYIETFEIKDVKTLQGEHLGRAIGRIAGKDGKTKFAIENASRTRIVLADQKVHILGGFKNIHVAREAVVSLILGSPPGKVYNNLRTVAARMKERESSTTNTSVTFYNSKMKILANLSPHPMQILSVLLGILALGELFTVPQRKTTAKDGDIARVGITVLGHIIALENPSLRADFCEVFNARWNRNQASLSAIVEYAPTGRLGSSITYEMSTDSYSQLMPNE